MPGIDSQIMIQLKGAFLTANSETTVFRVSLPLPLANRPGLLNPRNTIALTTPHESMREVPKSFLPHLNGIALMSNHDSSSEYPSLPTAQPITINNGIDQNPRC